MKEQKFGLSNPVEASIEQSAFIASGNYSIPFACGKTFRRNRKLIGFNPSSGNILVKEETCCDDYNYHKTLVISREGRPEKFRGDNF